MDRGLGIIETLRLRFAHRIVDSGAPRKASRPYRVTVD